MDPTTGKIVDLDLIPESKRKNYIRIMRDLTVKELADMQIRLYAPCGCGSGKKFKFCCYKETGGYP